MIQNICTHFLLDMALKRHDCANDQFKLALYLAGAASWLDWRTITTYQITSETSGAGYNAGGYNLALKAGFPKISSDQRKVLIAFDDVAVAPALFVCRYGLIYNATSANRVVATLNFGLNRYSTIDFGIKWPPSDDDNCLIRLGVVGG